MGFRFVATLLLAAGTAFGQPGSPQFPVLSPGLAYTNYRVASVPWSVHVVQVERGNPLYGLHSVHADRRAVGLSLLSAQIALLDPALGKPVAAINGDFYQRFKAYAGSPRGLQIAEGEVLGGPAGSVSFWIDAFGQPHADNVASQFQITWPDGQSTPFGMNGPRRSDGVELYTPSVGASTRTIGGRELLLERQASTPWLPLRIGRMYQARVREVRETGDTPLAPGTLVLSLGPAAKQRFSSVSTGAVLQVSTKTMPMLQGIKTAISGGPLLVRGGKPQKVRPSDAEGYEVSSMFERHPRSAIGWNRQRFFLVEVDGRQRGLSVGMTLEEFSTFLVKLGCDEAMNLDGGGSATLWYKGQVRNRPCDGRERVIANALVVIQREPEAGTANASSK